MIPVYNRKCYIGDCIQSALNQTLIDFEIVIVDNCSSDGTWEICQDYFARDSRIRIFRNESNIGPVRNWIRCAAEAKGEYSKILFSDDLLESNCLSEMLPLLGDPDVGLVYSAVLIGESKLNAVETYSSPRPFKHTSSQFLDYVLSGKAPVSPCGILIRTNDLLANIRSHIPTKIPRLFEKHGAGPDIMISLLTLKKYKYVAYVNHPVVFFRAHSGSISVENLNNEIRDSYLSALSYFVKNNESWIFWVKYMSYIWALETFKKKSWQSPVIFLRKYEGNGSILEVILGFFMLTKQVLFYVWRKYLLI